MDIYESWLTSAFDASQSDKLIQTDDWHATLCGLRALCDNETVRERMIRDEIPWLVHNVSAASMIHAFSGLKCLILIIISKYQA